MEMEEFHEIMVYTPQDVYNYTNGGDVDNLMLALDYDNNSIDWYTDGDGFVALLEAAYQGHTECIGLLLDRGADIDSRDNVENVGNTALHYAAQQGHSECIHELLNRGADIEINNSVGSTALHIAAQQGQATCVGVLLDREAYIESEQMQGYTALLLATAGGHSSCIGVLLDRGADIESGSNHGYTPLFVAAQQGHIDCTRLLLDRQAIIDEEGIDDIEHQECKQMILDETQHRLRRTAFNIFVSHHIEYPPLIHNIYSRCFPSGDLRVASPAIGWNRAEAVRNKNYFDEVLFYVHLFVANELAKKAKIPQKRTRASSRRCSNIQGYLASSSDDTSTLMTVLSDRLKMYLKPV